MKTKVVGVENDLVKITFCRDRANREVRYSLDVTVRSKLYREQKSFVNIPIVHGFDLEQVGRAAAMAAERVIVNTGDPKLDPSEAYRQAKDGAYELFTSIQQNPDMAKELAARRNWDKDYQ